MERSSILFTIISFLVFANAMNFSLNILDYRNSTGYGTEWMYFPDGDDIPRRISLEMPSEDLMRFKFWIEGLEFRLYNRYNHKKYILLDELANPINDTDLQILEHLKRAPIKLVTHGWESSADKNAVINIMEAYLEMQDVNVIGVDWSSVADSILYPIVAGQTWKVGFVIGEFLDALGERYNVSGNQIHLIGHSLGAHVMGSAGHVTKLKVKRITGLDPARPLFEYPPTSDNLKLDPTDAEFVDIIHTCAGILGVSQPFGHADFFPNQGSAPQPGCADWEALMEACSHSRSHHLFAESIRAPYNFPAYPCNSWNLFSVGQCKNSNTFLGEKANTSAVGSFYLSTNKNSPFGRGLEVN